MKTQAPLFLTKTGLYEYLLIVQPDTKTYNKVTDEKKNFSLEYHQELAVKTSPHITITNFIAIEIMEDRVIHLMQNILSKEKSFVATLNNYSGFPPHTIYLRVQDPEPFRQLMHQLKAKNKTKDKKQSAVTGPKKQRA